LPNPTPVPDLRASNFSQTRSASGSAHANEFPATGH
jgi:hypothetical protein